MMEIKGDMFWETLERDENEEEEEEYKTVQRRMRKRKRDNLKWYVLINRPGVAGLFYKHLSY